MWDYIKIGLQEVELGHGLDWGGSGYGIFAGNGQCCTENQDAIYCSELLDWL